MFFKMPCWRGELEGERQGNAHKGAQVQSYENEGLNQLRWDTSLDQVVTTTWRSTKMAFRVIPQAVL